MGDLIQFPEGGRDAAPREPVITPSMYCAACGKPHDVPTYAADAPCPCGGRVFTSDPNLGCGLGASVVVTSPIPAEVVIPGMTFGTVPFDGNTGR